MQWQKEGKGSGEEGTQVKIDSRPVIPLGINKTYLVIMEELLIFF